jgi:hypothetical protein
MNDEDLRRQRQRSRSLLIAGLLIAFVVLVYGIGIVRMQAGA